MSPPGRVYLVGAGPGDPGLVTVRARELIADADALVYDNLVNDAVLEWAKPGCELHYVGKEPGRHAIAQDEIGALIVGRARAGLDVVRLKGGDPFVFGRGGEEVGCLAAAGLAFEVVPGVTAALAGAACAGIPLTHRELSSSICFLTGHENPDKHTFRVDFKRFATVGGTLCIYMGMGQLPRIVGELSAGGLPGETPVAVVQWASLPRQRSVRATLDSVVGEVGAAGLAAPAVVYVGPVAALPGASAWFEGRPLAGRRVVVTRSRHQAGRLCAQLAAAGAEVLEIPLIDVAPRYDPAAVEEVFAELGAYAWVVFTSANGVDGFFERFFEVFEDLRSLGLLRIAAVGGATAAAVVAHRLSVDLIPGRADGEALAEALIEHQSMASERVLVVTGNLNRDVVMKKLEEAGAIVDRLQVYATETTDLSAHPGAARFRREGADAVVFASSSAVASFIEQAGSLQLEEGARRPAVASIGPLTSAALRAAGLTVDVEAGEATLEAVVAALEKHFSSRGPGRAQPGH